MADDPAPGCPDPERLQENAAALYRALRRCLGILCESANLNNYRNLSDEELGRMWVAAARQAGHLLNKIDGLPYDSELVDG